MSQSINLLLKKEGRPLALSHGSLFLDLPRRWSNRSRFCTKAKKAAEAEAPAEPVEGVTEGDEQSEAPEEEDATPHPEKQPAGADQGKLDDTWDEFE